MKTQRLFYTALVLTLSLILFYLPAILFQVEKSGDIWEWDFLGIMMATFYSVTFLLNYFCFVPLLLRRRLKLPGFILANLCMVLITIFGIPYFIEHSGCPAHHLPGDSHADHSFARMLMRYAGFSLRDGIMVVLSASLGYAIRVGREKEEIYNRELQLNAEARKIELQSLKAQLNPHFLFNSLNNIYALIGFAPERAQETLHTLSKMLRFMIYDTSDSVPLEKEARFIGEYVDLMRLRMSQACRLDYYIDSAIPRDARIAPLLYVTLVENAFKHSGANGSDYFIRLTLRSIDEGDRSRILFRAENTYWKEKTEKAEAGGEREGHTGVGISNVRSQLHLLYPGRYRFEVEKSEGVFTATLVIDTDILLKGENLKGEHAVRGQ